MRFVTPPNSCTIVEISDLLQATSSTTNLEDVFKKFSADVRQICSPFGMPCLEFRQGVFAVH